MRNYNKNIAFGSKGEDEGLIYGKVSVAFGSAETSKFISVESERKERLGSHKLARI